MKLVLLLVVIALMQLVSAEWDLFPHYDDQAIADIRGMFVEEGAEMMTEEDLDAEAEVFDTLSQESQDFIDAMDAVTQEELAEIYKSQSCIKSCTKGKPVSNGKRATANGCGPEGTSFVTKLFNKALSAIAPASFTQCCNTHDINYGTCAGSSNARRGTADTAFLKCLNNAVAGMKKKTKRTGAEKVAMTLNLHKVFYTAVAKFGCGPYKAAQEAACKCA